MSGCLVTEESPGKESGLSCHKVESLEIEQRIKEEQLSIIQL